jgi:hypothetical protein
VRGYCIENLARLGGVRSSVVRAARWWNTLSRIKYVSDSSRSVAMLGYSYLWGRLDAPLSCCLRFVGAEMAEVRLSCPTTLSWHLSQSQQHQNIICTRQATSLHIMLGPAGHVYNRLPTLTSIRIIFIGPSQTRMFHASYSHATLTKIEPSILRYRDRSSRCVSPLHLASTQRTTKGRLCYPWTLTLTVA